MGRYNKKNMIFFRLLHFYGEIEQTLVFYDRFYEDE